MNNETDIKRKIRKLLNLAADARGNRPLSRAAAAAAKKLMKRHGWTEDDVRGEFEPIASDKSRRIFLQGEHSFDRLSTTSKIVLHMSDKSVQINFGIRPTSANIEFTGREETLDYSTGLWSKLHEFLGNQFKMLADKPRGPYSFLTGEGKMDEPSWLKGILNGFEDGLARYNQWQEFQQRREEHAKNSQHLLNCPPKPKRRVLPKFNPLALAVIPKPKASEPIEQPVEAPAFESGFDPAREDEPKAAQGSEPRNAAPLDQASWHNGIRIGWELFESINKSKTQK